MIGDEKHFLYDCSLYVDLYKKYLGDLVLVGDVCVDVSNVCDLEYAWRLHCVYIPWNEEKSIWHVIVILWNYGPKGPCIPENELE